MRISKDDEQYVLQCQLMPLDVDYVRKSSQQLPMFVENVPYEVKLNLSDDSLTKLMDSVAISQRMQLRRDDLNNVSDAMRVLRQHIEHGSLDHMVELLQKDAEKSFGDFKEAIKPHSNLDETQYLIAKCLNDIEDRASEYPLVSAKKAAILLGEMNTANPSRLVAKLKKERKMFGFHFGSSRSIQIPAFQFDVENLGVYKPVERLCNLLTGLNDWGVYKWLTTYDDDLECTPAQALSRPELEEDLLYIAGIFKSESTLRDLTFDAGGADNE